MFLPPPTLGPIPSPVLISLRGPALQRTRPHHHPV